MSYIGKTVKGIKSYQSCATLTFEDGDQLKLRAVERNYMVLVMRNSEKERIEVLVQKVVCKHGKLVVTRVDGSTTSFDMPAQWSIRLQQTLLTEEVESDRKNRKGLAWKRKNIFQAVENAGDSLD